MHLSRKKELWIFHVLFYLQLQLSSASKFEVNDREFFMDGQPFRVLSGSIHYFRMPSAYWRDRLHKMKAAGLNSISTYVEWSTHEPEERQYKFDGDSDLSRFLTIAQEEQLYVLLRIGPYICAERDMGGLPYWLLTKYPLIRLRSNDEDFLTETDVWLSKLFSIINIYLVGNGGPIILIQVENEYGSYGSDEAYKQRLSEMFFKYVGDNALLYTADGHKPNLLSRGAVPHAISTINFPAGSSVNHMLSMLKKISTGPMMNAEFYVGWLAHWSENLPRVNTDIIVDTLCDILSANSSVNFYMFCGGTNFEFTSGAYEYVDKSYSPLLTSYDYDAPISETGELTNKYFAIRDTIAKCSGNEGQTVELPTTSVMADYGSVILTPQLRLLSQEGRQILGKPYPEYKGVFLPTFENLKQRGGFMLYETVITISGGILFTEKPRDRIYVYVNYELMGIFDRSQENCVLLLKLAEKSTLSLLVENQGRLTAGPHLNDFKGILSPVVFNSTKLTGPWKVTGFPLDYLPVTLTDKWTLVPSFKNGPVVYMGIFMLTKNSTSDTFIDPRGWGKGYIWINGHNLGRYWPETGPQVTLYVPGVWLRLPPDHNILQILELERTPRLPTVKFVSKSITVQL